MRGRRESRDADEHDAAPVHGVVRVIDAAAAVEPVPSFDELMAMNLDELAEVVSVAEAQRRRAEVVLAAAVEVIGRRRLHTGDGHRTISEWCRSAFRWSNAEARRIVRNGAVLARLPRLVTVAGEGRVGVAQLSDLGRLGANPRVEGVLESCDEMLTDFAERFEHPEWKVLVDRWEAAADPDGAALDHADAHEGRRARVAMVGAQALLTAEGGTTDGAVLREVLDRFADAEFRADVAEAEARLGRQVTGSDLARTARQRAFDALVKVFLTAASAEGSPVGVEPLVNIVVDDTTAERLLRTLAGDTVPPRTALDPRTYRCETLDGVRLAEESALAAMMVGRLRRVLAAPDGRVLDLGRTRRLFTGAAREAVLLGQQHCAWSGCTIPTQRCETDHVLPWAWGGRTAPDNGARVCRHHNLFKSARVFDLRRDGEGAWRTLRPDGSALGPPGAPPVRAAAPRAGAPTGT